MKLYIYGYLNYYYNALGRIIFTYTSSKIYVTVFRCFQAATPTKIYAYDKRKTHAHKNNKKKRDKRTNKRLASH